MRRHLATIALVTLVALANCAPTPLKVVAAIPGHGAGLRLNEAIVITFDRPLEPGSLTADAARLVRGQDGGVVAGRFLVEGATLRFEPRVPCAADLHDAPFAPGENLRLELIGLPRLVGVRALDGSALDGGVALAVTAVTTVVDWRTAPLATLFVDPQPGPPELLTRPARLTQGRIVLRFSEPLDPRGLAAAHFWLHGPWSRASHPSENPGMSARLVENTGNAVVELELAAGVPLPSPLAVGESCDLRLEPDSLRDLGGASLVQNGRLADPYVRVEVAGD